MTEIVQSETLDKSPVQELDAERLRLAEAHEHTKPWYRWGPYLSERQWGTVREDYSPSGSAWDSFPHDHARSRAFRWGEDGLLGISDEQCRLTHIFMRGQDGRRPVFGANETFQTNMHWRDYPLFYEYFHGDTGRGVGASHQTGWTGLFAKLLEQTEGR